MNTVIIHLKCSLTYNLKVKLCKMKHPILSFFQGIQKQGEQVNHECMA